MRTLLPSVLQLRKARSLLRAGLDRCLAFDLVGAEELFAQAVRTSRQAGSTATIVDADEHLYLVLRRRRRHVEAVPVLEELATGHSRLGGPGGDAASAWRNELIATLGTLDRFAEAEPLCRAAVELAAARHGTASRQAAYARVTQAWCLRHLNRWSEAAGVSRQALADLEAGSGAEAPVTGWALVGLASALLHLGEPEAAEECLLRAHGNWDRVGESALADATLSRRRGPGDLGPPPPARSRKIRGAAPGPGPAALGPGPACLPAPGGRPRRGGESLRDQGGLPAPGDRERAAPG